MRIPNAESVLKRMKELDDKVDADIKAEEEENKNNKSQNKKKKDKGAKE